MLITTAGSRKKSQGETKKTTEKIGSKEVKKPLAQDERTNNHLTRLSLFVYKLIMVQQGNSTTIGLYQKSYQKKFF